MSKKNLVMLVILDGYGISKQIEGNAVYAAKKPNLEYLLANYPSTTLGTSGEDVGLPDGQMGNSNKPFKSWCWTYCLPKLNKS